MGSSSGDGTATPSGEPSDDFFSSWDKPSIKRPSNPPSRTQTPPVISRTASPFLNPGTNSNGTARPKSPFIGSESESSQSAHSAPRTVSSSAVRKTATTVGARKANVLGAKKTQKLGAKKVADTIDFDAAEKKAKEEAERTGKLGYDPDAETATADAQTRSASTTTEKTKIAAPKPLSPGKAAFGATRGHQRSESEVERLGMGMGRLGFGQIGGGAKTAATPPKKMGFGSMGPSKATEEGLSLPCIPPPAHISLNPNPILTNSPPTQTTTKNTRARNSAPRKAYRRTNSSAAPPSTRPPNPKPNPACKASKAPPPSPATRTLAGPKRTRRARMATMAIWRGRPGIL